MATARKRLAICIRNAGYEASLERRKIYQVLPDARASRRELIRVIDESGEDYLYPEAYFAPISLPQPLRKAVLAAA
ncbi:MAG: hypothetical protein KF790_12220 [Steroidobacteraceae bacterium]|nr:hypothetical protein [Steroidobacteraceae bacterium]MCW5572796.1 hypothetical protein [Steroidobacteraceae bacterium]